MNKSAIQKYAVWARNELIEQVKQRAYQYGIDEKGYGDENAASIAGRVLSDVEKRQRQSFIAEIERKGYQQAIEEVAYTWFNRFVALRFMEVNDYLPTHIRVLSDTNGTFNPEILGDVLHLDLPGLDKARVSELINDNATDDLYRYLLLTQCNALNDALPEMFEHMGEYTEILLPNNILRQDSVLGRLVTDIPEEDWLDAVQIIGWMYQYYNTEPKQAVFDGLKKNIKITKERIPAATQLFTPDWIVRYMVENSLGRIYVNAQLSILSFQSEAERIDKEKELADTMGWKYYLPEAEQTPEVRARLDAVQSSFAAGFDAEQIKVIDPCMGSGHILVYAFDVLMQIYRNAGYADRDATKLILEKNLHGLDIDRRAYQLACFALMMQARQYNRRIFNEGVKPQVYHPAGWPDGEEYGSLLKVDNLDMALAPTTEQDSLFANQWHYQRLLSQKYDVVVTNPPYMGSSGMNGRLAQFVKDHYPDSKSDLFAAFIERCGLFSKNSGYFAMITQHAWMFLSSYEKLRTKLRMQDTVNMAHLGPRAFAEISGEVVQSTAFVMRNWHITDYRGIYVRLVDINDADEKELVFLSGNHRHTASADNFAKIPGSPVAYWVGNNFLNLFGEKHSFKRIASAKAGLSTTDNERFLRFWFEVVFKTIGFSYNTTNETKDGQYVFVPHPKGGSFRKWFGNLEYVVDWYDNGKRIKEAAEGASGGRIVGSEFYFEEGLTWTDITSSGNLSVRIMPSGMIFNSSAPSCFLKNEKYKYYLLGAMNSKPARQYLLFLSPTYHFNSGPIEKLPIVIDNSFVQSINQLVTTNISLSRTDWDSFETSWDFKQHPLVRYKHALYKRSLYQEPQGYIKASYNDWALEADTRFQTLKANEEELNRIFIDIYGLQDELTPEVEDKDVTVRRADLRREIRSLLSYAVGCMFGRYSLDVEGLAFAGGEWDVSKYQAIVPDSDNIIPICDDEYFEDDTMGRFVDFVRKVYGAETLEENLKYVADALGGKGTPREIIRNYFLNDFYKDHCKIYQKRPIYWLFDSGKKNGFKALMYLHRYSRDQLAKLRTDYVHEQQERYRTQLAHIAESMNDANGADRVRLAKQQGKLTEQLQEISVFEEKVHHLADMQIEIDLDDGVKRNYELFADVLAKI